MKTTIDGTGRLVVPKALRDAIGLSADLTDWKKKHDDNGNNGN